MSKRGFPLLLLCLVTFHSVEGALYAHGAPARDSARARRWIASLRSKSESVRLRAAYDLQSLDPVTKRTVVALIQGLKDGNAYVRRYCASALAEVGPDSAPAIAALVNALKDKNQSVREHASVALGKIGAPAVPALVTALQRPYNIIGGRQGKVSQTQRFDVSGYVACALVQIGPAAIPALISASRGPSRQVRDYVMFVLEKIGKPAARHLIVALGDDNPNVRLLAAQVLAEIDHRDKGIASALAKALDDRDPRVQEYAALALERLGADAGDVLPTLIKALKHANLEVRVSAAVSIGNIGAGAAVAVPALVDSLKYEEVCPSAIDSLEKIGAETQTVVIALVGLLKSTNVLIKRKAARLLEKIGAPAVPLLAAMLTDPDPETRSTAASLLGAIGPKADTAVSALAALLHDPDTGVRSAAANALGSIGPGAKGAISALEGAFASQDAAVRAQSIYALGRIASETDEVVPELIRLLKDADSRVRARAIDALGRIGPKASSAAPHLISLLTGDSAWIASDALVHIGPSAVPLLLGVIDNGDKSARAAALRALRKIDPTGSIPTLIKALKDDQDDVRWAAATALAEIGPDAKLAIPGLSDALKDDLTRSINYVSRTAADALARMGPDGITALEDALRESNPILLRLMVLETLESIGLKAAPAVPALARLLEDSEPDIRLAAVSALERVGPGAKTAVPELARALSDRNALVRRMVVSALSRIGPEARAAVPALLTALKDSDVRVRADVANALGRIGGEEKTLGPPLIDALLDPDLSVRVAAAHALIDLGVNTGSGEPILAAVINDSYIHLHVDAALLAETRPPIRFSDRVLMRQVMTGVPGGVPGGVPAGGEFTFRKPARIALKVSPKRLRARTQVSALSSKEIEVDLPSLPWPPPRFSSRDVLPRSFLGTDDNNLQQVHERLAAALSEAGFDEQALFGVEGGFAVVTKMEQVYEDGTPYPGPIRWIKDTAPPSGLLGYLGRLLLEKPGHFRLFMFIITTLDDFQHSGEGLSEDEAREVILEGGRILPRGIGDLAFINHNCHVLVYHFEKKKAGIAVLHSPSELSTRMHLEKAGVWNRLGR